MILFIKKDKNDCNDKESQFSSPISSLNLSTSCSNNTNNSDICEKLLLIPYNGCPNPRPSPIFGFSPASESHQSLCMFVVFDNFTKI